MTEIDLGKEEMGLMNSQGVNLDEQNRKGEPSHLLASPVSALLIGICCLQDSSVEGGGSAV